MIVPDDLDEAGLYTERARAEGLEDAGTRIGPDDEFK